MLQMLQGVKGKNVGGTPPTNLMLQEKKVGALEHIGERSEVGVMEK